jgi:hypothetical protein
MGGDGQQGWARARHRAPLLRDGKNTRGGPDGRVAVAQTLKR